MKLSNDNCHLVLSKNDCIITSDSLIKYRIFEKSLDVKIVNKPSFDEHVKNICKRATSKLRAFAKATLYMDIGKPKLVLNAFFNAQFSNYPLIWIHQHQSRVNNNKIKYLHERPIQLIQLIYQSSPYKEILQKD